MVGKAMEKGKLAPPHQVPVNEIQKALITLDFGFGKC